MEHRKAQNPAKICTFRVGGSLLCLSLLLGNREVVSSSVAISKHCENATTSHVQINRCFGTSKARRAAFVDLFYVTLVLAKPANKARKFVITLCDFREKFVSLCNALYKCVSIVKYFLALKYILV